MRITLLLLALVATGLSLFAGAARAASVPPGGSITFLNVNNGGTDFVPPGGDLLDSDSRTIAVTYNAPPGGFTFNEDNHTQVHFKSEVRRDPITGKLSFLYQLDEVDDMRAGFEGASATYTWFAGFDTDLTGDGKRAGLVVSRSNDGVNLSANGGGMGEGGPPTLALATDATHFDRNGSITLMLKDEFAVNDPSSGVEVIRAATATADIARLTQASERWRKYARA